MEGRSVCFRNPASDEAIVNVKDRELPHFRYFYMESVIRVIAHNHDGKAGIHGKVLGVMSRLF